MAKRNFHSNFFKPKRFKSDFGVNDECGLPSDTEAALHFLKSKFATNSNSFPPVCFVHQLYSVVQDKTKVDREVAELKSQEKVILYKLRADRDDVAVIVAFYSDIAQHITNKCNSKVVINFLNNILPNIKDVSVTKECLTGSYSLSDKLINELVHDNLLVMKDVGSYWLSFPGAGEFMKAYFLGRKSLLRIITKSRYSEILESLLLTRKLPKKAVLGMEYHIHDVIGSEAVKCIETTTGRLLRIA